MTTRNPVYRGVKYRTFPSGRDYTFTFAWVVESRTWRAYIDVQPDYGQRPADAHSTHRLRDEHGSYVCWDSSISTLSQCQGVAALWADCTEQYRNVGVFAPPAGRPSVQDRSTLRSMTQTASPPRTQPTTAVRPTPGHRQNAVRRLLERARQGSL